MVFQFASTLLVVFLSITTSFCQTYPGTLINISGGTFTMGNNNPPQMFDDQDPEHLVTIDDFTMGDTEVSNAYYVIFLNDMNSLGNLLVEEGVPGDWSSDSTEIANGHAWSIIADSTLIGEWSGQVLIKLSNIAGGGQDTLNRCWIEWDSTSNVYSVVTGYENWPASWVNWYGAMMYADYYGVSLPTEAEWEYAARAGQQLEYPTNDGSLSYSQANYGSFGSTSNPNYLPYLSPVGEIFQPNPFGLFNMTGNVSEWCLDWYDVDFYQISVDSNYCCNPINNNVPVGIAVKVLRGGNYTYPGAFAMSSHRFDTPPFVTTDHMGFRVVIREQLDAKIETILPERFTLYQNYPNPFNPVTTLRYDLPENSLVNITIYDMLGREVITLIDQTQDAGYRSVNWNATNNYGKPVSAGIYLYQIQAGEYISTKKMVLLK
jgi:formylglycine-generating enzyme required for sulfatase activity